MFGRLDSAPRSLAVASLVALIAVPVLVSAQGYAPHESTTPPAAGRFEIVQSQLAAKDTYRLDRFKGLISRLVKDSKGRSLWESMDVVPRPLVGDAKAPRFQIFTSGIAARFTFLIDTANGDTWQLFEDRETKEEYWGRIE